MLITSTFEICIQQLSQVMLWLPYDAGLSAAAETLVGIFKRVIVSPTIYPRFLEFLHVDIQSTVHTLSRPWSRQLNDVMSEIECTQLFRRRHTTLQSHGLFALAKHLWCIDIAFISYSYHHDIQAIKIQKIIFIVWILQYTVRHSQTNDPRCARERIQSQWSVCVFW